MSHNDELQPLINSHDTTYESNLDTEDGVAGSEEIIEEDNRDRASGGGATVTCRVCEAAIELEGRSGQHVVKCAQCQEATPIRPAPPGKKYVRCPCTCLLICNAGSTRIACPRMNCRRVITLGHRDPQGSAVRAPAGSCRVTCVHCNEMFMFNTSTHTLARCPHCKKNSAVGGFARRRAMHILLTLVVAVIAAVVLTVVTASKASESKWLYGIWALAYLGVLYMVRQFIKYWLVKTSYVIAPI